MKRRVKSRKKQVILSILMLVTLVLVWGCGGNGDVKELLEEEPSQVEETTAAPEFEEPEQVVEEEQEEVTDSGEEQEEAIDVIEAEEEQEGLSEAELGDLLRSSKNLDEFYYEMYWTGAMELEFPDEEDETMDVEMITRVYLKEGLMRIETDYMGYTSVQIYDEDTYYYLDDESKIAYMTPLEFLDEPVTLDAYVDDVDESNINYVGKETIQGVSCNVMESKGLYTGFNLKMWLHEEYGFPMRVESNNDGDDLMVMELTEFQVGNLSDDLFKVPEGYLIEER